MNWQNIETVWCLRYLPFVIAFYFAVTTITISKDLPPRSSWDGGRSPAQPEPLLDRIVVLRGFYGRSME